MRKWKKIPVTLLLTSIVCLGLTACEAKKADDTSSNASVEKTMPETSNSAAQNSNATSEQNHSSKPSTSSKATSETTPKTTPVTPEAMTPETTPATPEATTPKTTPVTPEATTPETTPVAPEATTPETTPVAPETTTPEATPVAPEATAPETTPAAPASALPSNNHSNFTFETAKTALNADASMTYPVFDFGSEVLNAAVNDDIVRQNTALLQQYDAAYSDVRLNYQGAFLDLHNVVYTSYYMDYTQPGATKSNTFMFTRAYDLKRGGAAVRVTDLTYSARELAEALLTQDLDTYANPSLDPSIWEAQKSIILSQSEDELTSQLEKADFGSNNPTATIFTRKPADNLMTIYYPVGASLGDYAAFTVKVYN